ncbi:MFS transporter [Sphingobacteriaceae bacterium]|nr:MFS transporter [Sphingobacteriaceae bacterium]
MSTSTLNQKMGTYRWTICSLLFFATTINYLDRVVIALLKSDLTVYFNWSGIEAIENYANLEIVFKISYAFGMVIAGRLIDKLGTKIGYGLFTFLWSVAAVCHALAKSTLGFGFARFGLGVMESGNFPAAIKTVAEWFPKKERAFATGIFNSGANIGAIIAPLSVPVIAERWGWQWAFIITGSMGFIWLIFWFLLYEIPAKQARLKKEEFDYIHSDVDEQNDTATNESAPRITWAKLLTFKQTWAFVLGKFLTDPIWWFYLFWLPDFLQNQYGLKGTEVSFPVAMVYIMSSFGSIGGGWLPMFLINRGVPAFKARKRSMLVYAFLVIPIISAQLLGSLNMWLAVMVIGLATAAHQAWSANIFTTVSDMFPKRATASVTGIGGMFGALGGIALTLLVQKRLFVYFESLGKIEVAYYIMFIVCGLAYLLAWLIMHVLVPKMKPVEI